MTWHATLIAHFANTLRGEIHTLSPARVLRRKELRRGKGNVSVQKNARCERLRAAAAMGWAACWTTSTTGTPNR
jgi:hypothetical protein